MKNIAPAVSRPFTIYALKLDFFRNHGKFHVQFHCIKVAQKVILLTIDQLA